MSPTELTVWWVLAGIGLGGSMLCSGLETGLYAASSVRAFVRARVKDAPVRDRAMSEAIERPDRSLTTLLLFNNAFNYIGTLAVTALLATTGLSEWMLVVLQAAVLTPVLLVFAESLPKELFRSDPDRMVRRFVPALSVMQQAGRWTGTVPAIAFASRGLGGLLGADSAGALSTPRARSAELIKHGSPALSEAQTGLIDRALLVESTLVLDEMVPLHAAACLRADWDAGRAKAAIMRSPHSAYPVLNARGRVVGSVGLVEMLRRPTERLGMMATDCPRVDQQCSAWEALGILRSSGAPLAIVERDGQAIGVVTHKDLVEPMTGDLRAW
ncbi:MAG: CNNM domain-containing protein [Phycisphaerales bacterium]